MERIKDLNLPWYIKEDLVDLLEDHPTLLEMSEEELTKLAQDKYITANDYYYRCNRLESDASAIEKFRDAKFGSISCVDVI